MDLGIKGKTALVTGSTAGTGVTVNAVLPGPTRSEGASAFFGNLARTQQVSEAKVAAMVVYVCSALAAATNGAALRADGGGVRSIT